MPSSRSATLVALCFVTAAIVAAEPACQSDSSTTPADGGSAPSSCVAGDDTGCPPGEFCPSNGACTASLPDGSAGCDRNRMCSSDNCVGGTCCPSGCPSCAGATCLYDCGNGTVDSGEQCDEGAANGTACTPPANGSCQYCDSNCQWAEAVDVAACEEGVVASQCLCGTTVVTDGYCCGGVPQADACNHYGGGGDTYYIDPTGADSAAQDGSSSSPWLTLAYACSRVTSPGDIIHVNPGSYTETVQCALAAGVSIEGEGDSSIIRSEVGGSDFTILLDSGAEATDGNQRIAALHMDGSSLTAYGAIRVAYRKNVEIYACTFVDFEYYGVSFIDGEPPTVYATGNRFYGNTVSNCSGFFSGNRGSLEIQGQDGMLIYGNQMTQDRADGMNGDIIYGVEGFLKNVKIFNNTLAKAYSPGTTPWDFAIEFWNCQGGVEIHHNAIIGSIDLVMSSKGSSAYSVWVHHNTIGQDSLKSSQAVRGVLMEYQTEGVIIEKNTIRNVAAGIFLQQSNGPRPVQNIDVRYNVLYGLGIASGGTPSTGWGIYWSIEDYDDPVDGVNVWNNVFVASQTGEATAYGIGLPDIGTATNISVRNNIVQGFDMAPVYANGTGGTTIDYLSLEANIFNGNGNGDSPRYDSGMSPTHATENNLVTDPLFVSASDFHLQPGSPAHDAGMDVGLTSDIEDNPIVGLPDIGAYELP